MKNSTDRLHQVRVLKLSQASGVGEEGGVAVIDGGNEHKNIMSTTTSTFIRQGSYM